MATNNTYLYFLLAILTGMLIPIQAATNSVFSKSIGNPFVTGFMVFVVGLIAIGLFLVLSKTALPAPAQMAKAPMYSYLGGMIVATYVIMITIITPKIGVGNAIGLIVTGQILAAIAIDHFGLFNVAVRTITLGRFIGMVLMILGIYLVMKKDGA